MFCGKCGKKLPDEAKFCTECGYKLPERKLKEEPKIEPVIPVVEQPTYEPDDWYTPETPVEQPAYQPAEDWYTPEEPAEQTYETENDWGTPEPTPVVKPEKVKKQRQPKPKKKGKAGVVIAIILLLALAAGAVWWFFLGGKKNQIEVSDEIIEAINEHDSLDQYDDPIKITYAKVTNVEEDDDYKEEYITVKGENKYVTFEGGYIASYSKDDDEWELEDVSKNFDYDFVGHAFVTPHENITKDTVKDLVCELFENSELRFDDISIGKYEHDEYCTEVDLTVTGEIYEEYVKAEIEAEFGVSPDGWYILDLDITDTKEAEEDQVSVESDRPIPIETEKTDVETDIAETAAHETEAPEIEETETESPETEAPETEAPETEEPETEAPQTTPPATEAPQTTPPATEAPETEAPVVSDPKASLRVPAGYEVSVFTHDEATGKTIVIAKKTSDRMYYILDTNGNLLIDMAFDSYSNIDSPYFGQKAKIYKYNFSKNIMEDVAREVYERLADNVPTDTYYNKELDLLVKVNEKWSTEWDQYTILDSRYNKQYYEMQLSLFDSYPRAGSYEQRKALQDNGNPYDMIGHTPIVVKKCSFSTSRMRLTDTLGVEMVITNFSTTNKYGVFGANVPFEYDELYAYAPEWSPLWYVAKVGNDWGVLDNNNVQVIKFKYGDVMIFANPEGDSYRLYAVVSKVVNGKKTWGVVDQDGNTIIPFEYEQIVPINFTTELRQVGCLGVAKTGYTNENLEFYVKKSGSWSAISAK